MVIWTFIEPAVGVISSCLPTLRPLILQIGIQGRKFRTAYSTYKTHTKLDGEIQLEPGHSKWPVEDSTDHIRWRDHGFELQPSNGVSTQTTVGSSLAGPNTDNDDMALMGINVQRDVRIEHAPLQACPPR